MIYLTLAELVYIAERATGGQVIIRDAGLLKAAAARPQATAFGSDAYPDLHAKAAALVHSRCHPRKIDRPPALRQAPSEDRSKSNSLWRFEPSSAAS